MPPHVQHLHAAIRAINRVENAPRGSFTRGDLCAAASHNADKNGDGCERALDVPLSQRQRLGVE